jgi:hypothetical protein
MHIHSYNTFSNQLQVSEASCLAVGIAYSLHIPRLILNELDDKILVDILSACLDLFPEHIKVVCSSRELDIEV